MLLDYEYVQTLLNLNREDEKIDRLFLHSVYDQMCNILGYDIELKGYSEVLEVVDYKVILSHFPVTSIEDITDCKINASLDYFSVDYPNRSILFQPGINGHRVFVNYKAGYTEETLPADLKEAMIKYYIFRKNEFYKFMNNGEDDSDEECIPADIKRIFDFYCKKRL